MHRTARRERLPVRAAGRGYILGAMASMWRLQRHLPGGEAGPRLRALLTAVVTRGPQLASIVLGVAIGAQVITIALSLAAEISAGSGVRFTTSARAPNRRLAALDDITAAHLFGVRPTEMKAADASVARRSPLVLTGTLATSDPRNGFAMVGSTAESTHLIYVGSEAAPGTVLMEVYPQWVVLRRGGERLTLHLPREDLMTGGARASYRGGALLSESAPAPETDDSGGGGAFAMSAPLPRPEITDGAAVLRSFSMVAATVDGQQGMQIAGTAFNRKALAALGLHSGDVILQVNGAPIGSPNGDLIRAVQSGAATLTVVSRSGDATSVTLDASSMASAAALYRQADPDL